MSTLLLRVLFVSCSVGFLSGCSRDSADDAAEVTASAVDPPSESESMTPLDTTGAWRPEARTSLPSAEIYYTLTDFGWYARGEPLLRDGVPHMPSGLPIAASADEMQAAGEYEGVQFYMRRDAADVSVYVPVFEGYWLPFRPEAAAAAAAQAAAPER